ncbi:MAG: hypothetical protein ABWX94_01380 [Candidatus Saccharimonadales bacterium]
MNSSETSPSALSFETIANTYNPENLPEGIGSAVAIIAGVNPPELSSAQFDFTKRYWEAAYLASGRLAAIDMATHEELAAAVQAGNSEILDGEVRHAQQLGDYLGMELSLGGIPEANELERMFAADTAVADARQRVAEEHPTIVEAADQAVESSMAAFQGSEDLQAMAPYVELSCEVKLERGRLARRGQWKSVVAGAFLGVAAALGINEVAQAQDQQPTQSVEQVTLIVDGTAIALGSLAGLGISVRRRDVFAHKRAKKLVEKAEKIRP